MKMVKYQKHMTFSPSTVIRKMIGNHLLQIQSEVSVFSLMTLFLKTGQDFMRQKSRNWFFNQVLG